MYSVRDITFYMQIFRDLRKGDAYFFISKYFLMRGKDKAPYPRFVEEDYKRVEEREFIRENIN